MNRTLIALSSVVWFSIAHSQTETIPFPPIFFADPIQRFQAIEQPRFNLIERELQNLTARRGDPKVNNVFCASGFIFPNELERVAVVWTNKDQLYVWPGTTDPQDREESISLSLSPYSDLINVAEDGAILSGPTTLNRSQAKAAVEDCEQYGQKFLVRPFTPAKEQDGEEDETAIENIETPLPDLGS